MNHWHSCCDNTVLDCGGNQCLAIPLATVEITGARIVDEPSSLDCGFNTISTMDNVGAPLGTCNWTTQFGGGSDVFDEFGPECPTGGNVLFIQFSTFRCIVDTFGNPPIAYWTFGTIIRDVFAGILFTLTYRTPVIAGQEAQPPLGLVMPFLGCTGCDNFTLKPGTCTLTDFP